MEVGCSDGGLSVWMRTTKHFSRLKNTFCDQDRSTNEKQDHWKVVEERQQWASIPLPPSPLLEQWYCRPQAVIYTPPPIPALFVSQPSVTSLILHPVIVSCTPLHPSGVDTERRYLDVKEKRKRKDQSFEKEKVKRNKDIHVNNNMCCHHCPLWLWGITNERWWRLWQNGCAFIVVYLMKEMYR